MNPGQLLTIFVSAIFINNVILSRFLGLCPFVAVSKETKPALAMSMAISFVITSSAIITWLIYRYLLIPFNLTYLRTMSFILVIAAFVQLVEMAIRKMAPALHKAFGIYLPLITTNCAVLGTTVLNSDMFFIKGQPIAFSFILAIFQAIAISLGFTLAMLLMSGIRERLELYDLPEAVKGLPLAFIIASLMSLAFMGFAGFKF